MLDPKVSIIFDREAAPGATSLAAFEAEPGKYLADEHVPISEAIAREWEHDAHLTMYAACDDQGTAVFPRINKRGSSFVGDLLAQGGRVACSVLIFDHDLPEKAEWTEDGLGEFVRFIAESDFHLPTYWYTTLHGSRFVYVLDEPVSHAEAEGLMLGIMRDALAEGLELDTACKDWTRLFRLPRVLRDGTRTEDAANFECYEFGETLDPSTIEPGEATGLDDEFVEVQHYRGSLPDPDDCHELLFDVSSKTGKDVKSKWVKTARQYLTGRDSFDYCFNNKVICEGDIFEGRNFSGSNDALLRVVGQMVGQLARQEEATPEGIYALLIGALDQLEPTAKHPDWHVVAWDLICRMWSSELAQVEAEFRQRERDLAEASVTRDGLIDLFRDKLPGTVPDEPAEAEEWLRERMIASTGMKHHIMMRDGSYTVSSFGDSMLIPAIRDLGMQDVIETHELAGKVWREKSPRSILNIQAIPISRLICSSTEDVATVAGDPGYRTLTIPIHKLDPHLHPVFSDDVDRWLKYFFGDGYDKGVEWLSHCLDVKRAICALNLYGASGAGKGMLVSGISECFRYKSKTSGNKVFTRFNETLLDSPIVHFDEGVPTVNAPGCNTTDQTFRAMVSGGSIDIEPKGGKVISAQIYPRILFTSNDHDILRSIVGNRDLSDDDIAAIEVRLMTIGVPPSATTYLVGKGSHSHTTGWIGGELASKYILAQHILYLHEHRKPSKRGSGRLLVEGDMGTGQMRDMRMRTDSASAVVRTISKMIEDPNGCEGMHINNGHIWVLPYGVQRMYEKRLQETVRSKLTTHAISKVLRQLCIEEDSPSPRRLTGQTKDATKQRWWEIDLRILVHEAIKHGMPRERMELYLKENYGIEELARIHGYFSGDQL
jgi:hypothetical protein